MTAEELHEHGEGCSCEFDLTLGTLIIRWGLDADGSMGSSFHLDEGAQEMTVGQIVGGLESIKFKLLFSSAIQQLPEEGSDE